jgi:hypothetical protein
MRKCTLVVIGIISLVSAPVLAAEQFGIPYFSYLESRYMNSWSDTAPVYRMNNYEDNQKAIRRYEPSSNEQQHTSANSNNFVSYESQSNTNSQPTTGEQNQQNQVTY